MKTRAKPTTPKHPTSLEAWVDVATHVCATQGFLPGRLPEMRKLYGTVETMKQLLTRPLAVTPICRLKEKGLAEWSIEAGVLRFPDPFTKAELENAQFRLDNACDPNSDNGTWFRRWLDAHLASQRASA